MKELISFIHSDKTLIIMYYGCLIISIICLIIGFVNDINVLAISFSIIFGFIFIAINFTLFRLNKRL